MLKLALLFFFTQLVPPASNSEFRLLYGNVLAQRLSNESVSDSDIATAVQIAQKAVLSHRQTTNKATPDLHRLAKSRLYYTVDGRTPYVLEQKYIVSDRVFLQTANIVLGMHYTVSLTLGDDDCSKVWHNITLISDHRREYHVYRHTFLVHADLSKTSLNFSATCLRKSAQTSGNLYQKQSHYASSYLTQPEQLSRSIDGEICESTLECSVTDSCLFDTSLPERALPGNQCPSAQGRSCSATKERERLRGSRSLRVATYNVWNLNSHEWEGYTDRMERLGKMLASQALDIVGVQEVRFEAGDHTHNQIATLARFLPHHQYVFQPAMLYMHDLSVRTEEGLAIFSRYPILDSDYILLPRNESDVEDDHQRICLHTEIHIPPLGKVHVFVTHLSLSPSAQEKSVVEIWQYMSKFRGIKFLLGDLNSKPQSTPIRFLRGEVEVGRVHTEGLSDTWFIGGSGNKRGGLTFSALTDIPTKRIDYIFLQQPHKDVHVVNTTVMDEQDHCCSPCSDHYGVATTIGYH